MSSRFKTKKSQLCPSEGPRSNSWPVVALSTRILTFPPKKDPGLLAEFASKEKSCDDRVNMIHPRAWQGLWFGFLLAGFLVSCSS